MRQDPPPTERKWPEPERAHTAPPRSLTIAIGLVCSCPAISPIKMTSNYKYPELGSRSDASLSVNVSPSARPADGRNTATAKYFLRGDGRATSDTQTRISRTELPGYGAGTPHSS